jgi:hypothetical protein
MLFIADIKLYDNVDIAELKSCLCESENSNKQEILKYLKNSLFESSCTTEKVFDYINNKRTDIPIVAYHDDKYYWDDRYIYYFEKYNLKLNDDFIEYVLKHS